MDDLMLPEPTIHEDGVWRIEYYIATQMREAIKQAVEAEREACALIVENEAAQYVEPVWALEIVNDIRARSQA